jgi:PAS domain S-box-containing protein
VKNTGETVLLASIKMAFRLYDAHMELKKQKENLRTALVQQEQIEEELIAKSDELDRYFNSSLDLLCIATVGGDFIRLNPEWEKLLGYTIDELEGRSFMDFIHEDDKESTREALSRLDDEEEVHNFVNRYCCKDGSYRWLEWRSTPSGSTVYAVARDITKRKEMEDNLRITLDSIGDAVISTDIDGRIIRMNPVAERLCGWPLDDALGKQLNSVFRIVNAHTREKVDNPVAKVIRTGRIVGLANHTMLMSKQGSTYHIADSAAPIKDDSGRLGGVVLVFRDVSKEYEMEEALRESEEKYRTLFDQSVEGIFLHDLDGRIIDVNDMVCTQTGYSREELLQLTVFDLQCHDDATINMPKDEILRLWRQWEPGQRFSIEAEHIKKDGTVYPVRVSTGPIHYGNENVIMAIVEDITERKENEQKLQRALEEKDYLMRELNHRVKNNLNMVSSLIGLKEDDIEEDLSDVTHQIDAIRLVHETLHRPNEIHSINLREYIQELLDTIFASFSYGEVTVRNSVEELSIHTKFAIPLGLIINEIATNAIKHGFDPEEEARFFVDMKKDEESRTYILRLSNNGLPFPEDIDPDSSESLGLQLINTLAQQLEGTVELEKKPNTTFTIRFPMAEG